MDKETTMLDEKLLDQYYELLGSDGVREMYDTFNDNISGYLDHLKHLVGKRDEGDTRRQAHKVKGACRSVGLAQLASQMERLEREEWHWQDADDLLEQWVIELPLHQHQLRRWLHARGIQ
ncbi:Hpt domain-containing protein [Pseudidiomarina sp.]|uniref:Hpt domain-containing protein n=1 Tax=Pseudidiomarina sp. TaxID=2081707 RepID=UPI003A97F959